MSSRAERSRSRRPGGPGPGPKLATLASTGKASGPISCHAPIRAMPTLRPKRFKMPREVPGESAAPSQPGCRGSTLGALAPPLSASATRCAPTLLSYLGRRRTYCDGFWRAKARGSRLSPALLCVSSSPRENPPGRLGWAHHAMMAARQLQSGEVGAQRLRWRSHRKWVAQWRGAAVPSRPALSCPRDPGVSVRVRA